jgi:hypothetical protein
MFGILTPKKPKALPVQGTKSENSKKGKGVLETKIEKKEEDLNGYLYLVMPEPVEYRKEALLSLKIIREKQMPHSLRLLMLRELRSTLQEMSSNMNCLLFKLPAIQVAFLFVL